MFACTFQIQSRDSRSIFIKVPAMRKDSRLPDFNAAASVIQGCYRHYTSGKVLRTALARFRSIEKSIEKQMQAIFPSYQYEDKQDFLQRYPPWPLFTMDRLEYDNPARSDSFIEAASDLADYPTKEEEPVKQLRANSELRLGSIELLDTSIEKREPIRVQHNRAEDRNIILKRLNELEKEQRWLEQAIIERVEMLRTRQEVS